MRLIDADALDMYERLKSYYGMAWRDAQEEIDAQPTVDAVPVIRCKDCKHYADECCDRYADETLGYVHSTQEYGYCWVAERKEE